MLPPGGIDGGHLYGNEVEPEVKMFLAIVSGERRYVSHRPDALLAYIIVSEPAVVVNRGRMGVFVPFESYTVTFSRNPNSVASKAYNNLRELELPFRQSTRLGYPQ